jgi:polysaccharide deacetylase family protein (PEP-CTERM system associated)
MSVLNALTIDVEDYYQVSAFEPYIDRSQWDSFESRVVANTRSVLELLKDHRVKATFFVLGWTAERFPEMVREILDEGHEIGSHGYWHRLVYRQSPDEFRADIRRADDALRAITEAPVTAYRAPSFSITAKSLWALDVLAEEGFRIDSSVFPIHHDRYGIPGAKTGIHRLETSAGSLWEFPPSVMTVGPWNLPVSGGGYFRLYPISWTLQCLGRLSRAKSPFMFYLHPWELDPDQPRLNLGSPVTRFRHYVNLRRTRDKLNRLLQEYRFGRISDALQEASASRQATP